jgi:hypothetical protein
VNLLSLQGVISDLDFNFDLMDIETDNVFINSQEIILTTIVVALITGLVYLFYRQFKSKSKRVKKYSEMFFRSLKFNTPIRFMIETYIIALLSVAI